MIEGVLNNRNNIFLPIYYALLFLGTSNIALEISFLPLNKAIFGLSGLDFFKKVLHACFGHVHKLIFAKIIRACNQSVRPASNSVSINQASKD